MNILPADRYGYDFISAEYLPKDLPKDLHGVNTFGINALSYNEYWLRNAQQAELFSKKPDSWRHLKIEEIEALKKNRNNCSNWNNFLVSDPFDPSLIYDSSFYGLVRIGALRNVLLKHNDFCVPAGIRNSVIISCDIGDDTAIQYCAYISHYIIGDNCILSKIDEMQTTNHAKFGNGVIKDGESEEVRVWIDVMNEAGGRSILPFDTMIAADAYLWAAYRDDTVMTDKLADITQKQYGSLRGSYGVVGSGATIKSCSVIKDTAIGSCAYIKGANKLKNLTIHSSSEEPTQIGEGVEMVNGIVGYACNIFYGAKAVRFVIGRNSSLKYGARLIHSVLGDNSTVSCCEMLNNLIFPVHEQHHNNSFLIASLIQGMSNMAAAATVGSNHNSRANDGEIRAKRGFWPGLAVSLKHSCVFASFVIIAKGEYPSELNIPFPFALVNNNVHKNRLEVMPAYFWLHNLYALERNSWKSKTRDKRKIKNQRIETDYLAPDTAEEIIHALAVLNGWLGESGYSAQDMTGVDGTPLRLILCRHLEHSKRGQVIIKPLEAIAGYRQMLRYYAVKTLAEFFDAHSELDYQGFLELLGPPAPKDRVKDWTNIGGQIVPSFRIDELRKSIRQNEIRNWDEIHRVYGHWDEAYPFDKCSHAWSTLALIRYSEDALPAAAFKTEIALVQGIRHWIDKQIYDSRAKDFHSSFKRATYRNTAEMEQVLGVHSDNPFLHIVQKESDDFFEMTERVTKRL